MLYNLSRKIVALWSREGIIPKKYEEAYVYGVQLILSTVLNISAIAIISNLIGKTFVWIPFLIGFIPIRVTAGGFHAQTPLHCSLVFCGSYWVCQVLLTYVRNSDIPTLMLVGCAITSWIVTSLSPIPAANKPLSQTEKERKHSLSCAIVSTLLLITIASIHLNVALEFTLQIVSGAFVATILLCICMFQIMFINRE